MKINRNRYASGTDAADGRVVPQPSHIGGIHRSNIYPADVVYSPFALRSPPLEVRLHNLY